MKIVVINQPMGNRGDESAHKALMRALSNTYPNADIEMLAYGYSQFKIDQIAANEPNVTYTRIDTVGGSGKMLQLSYQYDTNIPVAFSSSLRTFKNKIKCADVVINAPGGICMGGFYNWIHVALLGIAKRMGKPIAYFGRSIGPFDDSSEEFRLFKRRSFELLRYFGYISLRDAKSLKIADEIGIHPIQTVDTAFLDNTSAEIPDEVAKKIQGKKYVVFVPNSLTWHFMYKNIAQDAIDDFYISIIQYILKDNDIMIVMLPQVPENNKNANDRYYFESLKNKGNSERIIVVDDKYGSDIQQSIISKAEYVIGSRYHTIVFAINNAVPFVSLSYEHKMSGLLETLEIKDRMVDITKIFNNKTTIDSAFITVVDKINSIPDCKDSCKEWQIEAKRIALNGFNNLKDYISQIKN